MFNISDVIIWGIDDFIPGECTATAIYNGKQIGYISFYVLGDMDEDNIIEANPHIAHIDPEYTGHGIGTKIITEVSRICRVKFLNSCNNVCEDKDDIHYTEAGLSFMQHCCNVGIATNDTDAEARNIKNDFLEMDCV